MGVRQCVRVVSVVKVGGWVGEEVGRRIDNLLET